ncbi:MAG: cohesin domain-containing protein [Methanosarcinales archaeon]
MLNLKTLIALLIGIVFLSPVSATSVSVGDMELLDNIVQVPINIKDAVDVASLDIIIKYDESALDASEVDNGSLTSNSILFNNTDVQGEVRIGLIDLQGINGNGSIATIKFEKLKNNIDKTSVTIDSVEAANINAKSIQITIEGARQLNNKEKTKEIIPALPDMPPMPPTSEVEETTNESVVSATTSTPTPTIESTQKVTKEQTEDLSTEETEEKKDTSAFEAIFAIVCLLIIAYIMKQK